MKRFSSRLEIACSFSEATPRVETASDQTTNACLDHLSGFFFLSKRPLLEASLASIAITTAFDDHFSGRMKRTTTTKPTDVTI